MEKSTDKFAKFVPQTKRTEVGEMIMINDRWYERFPVSLGLYESAIQKTLGIAVYTDEQHTLENGEEIELVRRIKPK